MRSILPLFIAALAASAPAVAAEQIPMPHFNSVRISDGGNLSIVPGPVQRVVLVSGSREFTRFQMRRDGQLEISMACNARCPRNYDLRVRIESPQVPDLAVSEGGTIVAQGGFAPQRHIAAAVSEGGTIDLRSVTVDAVSAAVSSGGDIYVRPRRTLAAAVNAGGDVHYSGNPQVTMAVHNGGDVRRDD
jgi:autonomous glycyl radical cofactor GrcA